MGTRQVGSSGDLEIYYNRRGERIDHDTYLAHAADRDYKVVKKTIIHGNEVSTVWLGIDHSYGTGMILIFETMVFGGPLWESFERRYTTEGEALLGHSIISEMISWWYANKIGRHEWVKVSGRGNG